MENLVIQGTQQNPNVMLSSKTGELQISGQSIPEDAKALYSLIVDWIKEYSKNPAKETTLSFKMKYYNTATSKMFFSVFKEIQNLQKLGNAVKVQWFYQEDDEDMFDSGEYFKDLIDVPFEFITY